MNEEFSDHFGAYKLYEKPFSYRILLILEICEEKCRHM